MALFFCLFFLFFLLPSFSFLWPKSGVGQKRPVSADGPDPIVASLGQFVMGTWAGGIHALPVARKPRARVSEHAKLEA